VHGAQVVDRSAVQTSDCGEVCSETLDRGAINDFFAVQR